MEELKGIRLKPCPFCGGEPSVLTEEDDSPDRFLRMRVECQTCHIQTASICLCDNDSNVVEAILRNAWNVRV